VTTTPSALRKVAIFLLAIHEHGLPDLDPVSVVQWLAFMASQPSSIEQDASESTPIVNLIAAVFLPDETGVPVLSTRHIGSKRACLTPTMPFKRRFCAQMS
jgi:hypothetical protein